MVSSENTDQWQLGYYEHPLPTQPNGYPNGWMSASDLRLLYNVARRSTGDVLEVGPWLGRSTTAIASGLRDRAAAGTMPVMFDTVDYGITSAEEWQRRFGQPLKFAKDKGRTVEAVYHPGGTIAVLIRNLKANALLEHVTNVIRGDFNNSPIARSYSMIFCDATHDEEEIRKNLPRLSELGGEGCVFVFDDIVTQEHADLVCSYLNASRHFMTRSMFPEPGKRCKLLLVETG